MLVDAWTVAMWTLIVIGSIAAGSAVVFGTILMFRARRTRRPRPRRIAAGAIMIYLAVCAFTEANRSLPSIESAARYRDPVRGAIIDATAKYRIDRDRFISMAKCESRLDPNARSDSGTFLGVTQQHRRYWSARAARAGFRGASPYDPRANVFTAAHMIRHGGGWGHWPHCGYTYRGDR